MMTNVKKILMLPVVAAVLNAAVSAQEKPAFPKTCEIFYPEMLSRAIVLHESDANGLLENIDATQKNPPRNPAFWTVYSDRSDNPTYLDKSGSKKYGTLDFNEKVRIAEISNGYALVYTEPMEDIQFPLISQHAVCKGWVPVKNLLMWHTCLADDAGIYYKALLCYNLDNAAGEAGGSSGMMYLNPRKKSDAERIRSGNEFFFIMKREGNMVLIARNHSMEGYSDKVLYGWVDNDSYVAWNQRTCLEPTWKEDDVNYFLSKNTGIRIYTDKSLREVGLRLPFREWSAGAKTQTQKYRMPKDELRFPILDDGTDELYNCSSFGTPGGKDVVVEEENPKDSPLAYSEEMLRQMTNINIAVVIDGTSSMETFYPAVKEAIKQGVKFFAQNRYKVKVGVVIYRDYADGDYATEIFRLSSPDRPELYSFLDSGGKYGIRSAASDRTLEEAMYLGIDTALKKVGFKPDQSNILLVVGDCGNDRNDSRILPEEIVKGLVDKNVHLMGFQVRNGHEDAYGLFNDQLQSIMKNSLAVKYGKLMNGIKVSWKETKDGYELVNDVKSNLYVGSHSFPSVNRSVSSDRLSSLMQDAILYCSESVNYQIDLLASFQRQGFLPNAGGSSIIIEENFLRNRLGEDKFDKLKKNNTLLTFKGYARKTNAGRNLFKPVIFISSDELSSLITRLQPVKEVAIESSNDREPYVMALKALIQSMVPDIDDRRMNEMGYHEVMAMAAGLNEAASALKGPSIQEIASPQAVSFYEYQKLVIDFCTKYMTLCNIKSNPYPWTMSFNGHKYYWLPVEELP